MSGCELAVVVVRMPRRQVVRFQGMLDGEDGLAILRCRDAAADTQQLWTTRARLGELRAWIAGLPAKMRVEVVREA